MLPAPTAPPPPPDLVLVAAAAPVVVFRCFTVPPAPLFPAGDRLPAPTDVADAGTGIFFLLPSLFIYQGFLMNYKFLFSYKFVLLTFLY